MLSNRQDLAGIYLNLELWQQQYCVFLIPVFVCQCVGRNVLFDVLDDGSDRNCLISGAGQTLGQQLVIIDKNTQEVVTFLMCFFWKSFFPQVFDKKYFPPRSHHYDSPVGCEARRPLGARIM